MILAFILFTNSKSVIGFVWAACSGRQQHNRASAQLLMPLLHGEWVGKVRKWVEIWLLLFSVTASTDKSSQQGKCTTVYQWQMTSFWSTRAMQYTFMYFSIKRMSRWYRTYHTQMSVSPQWVGSGTIYQTDTLIQYPASTNFSQMTGISARHCIVLHRNPSETQAKFTFQNSKFLQTTTANCKSCLVLVTEFVLHFSGVEERECICASLGGWVWTTDIYHPGISFFFQKLPPKRSMLVSESSLKSPFAVSAVWDREATPFPWKVWMCCAEAIWFTIKKLKI